MEFLQLVFGFVAVDFIQIFLITNELGIFDSLLVDFELFELGIHSFCWNLFLDLDNWLFVSFEDEIFLGGVTDLGWHVRAGVLVHDFFVTNDPVSELVNFIIFVPHNLVGVGQEALSLLESEDCLVIFVLEFISSLLLFFEPELQLFDVGLEVIVFFDAVFEVPFFDVENFAKLLLFCLIVTQ